MNSNVSEDNPKIQHVFRGLEVDFGSITPGQPLSKVVFHGCSTKHSNSYCLTIARDKDGDEGYYIAFLTDRKELELERRVNQMLINLIAIERESRSLSDILESTHRELREVMEAENLYVILWDRYRLNLRFAYFKDEVDSFTSLPSGKTLNGYVIETGKPMLITQPDIERLQREGELDAVGTTAMAWMGVPITNKSEVVGAIVVQSYKSQDAYTRYHLNLLVSVATHISASIERRESQSILQRAKDRAVESDNLKTAFLANMSHEIRTPMNSIIGFSELLTRPTISQEKRDVYARMVSDSSKTLLKLIEDIIDIAKIEAGQLSIAKSHTNINGMIHDLLVSYQTIGQQLGGASVALSTHCAIKGSDFTILCDSIRVKQVLSNLLSNALKFTQQGQIVFGYLIPNNAAILFFVQDTGIGLSPGNQEIIFDRFRQGDDSTTRQYGGTGLGLAISRKLVELMGGRIWVESELGKGSTFYFTIPLITSSQTEEIHSEAQDIPHLQNLEGKTLLIAEDEDSNFFFLQEVLAPTRVGILRATNGREALEMIMANDSISLVLMDIQMPVLNGYLATQEIKRLKPNLPVVAQTAYAMAQERVRGLRAGCDDYLSKPINPNDILRVVRNYLAG